MSKSTVLKKGALDKALKKLPDWKTVSSNTKLRARFEHPDYVTGLVKIARIAVYAEMAQHHPDIVFTYGTVTVTLTTHDERGITKKDIDLATKISQLCNK